MIRKDTVVCHCHEHPRDSTSSSITFAPLGSMLHIPIAFTLHRATFPISLSMKVELMLLSGFFNFVIVFASEQACDGYCPMCVAWRGRTTLYRFFLSYYG